MAGWRDFTQWCRDTGVRGLPAAPADVGRYLEHLMEARGRALATARSRLAAVSAAHRLAGHPDPASRPLVKAALKRLGREHGKPRKQARGLTAEALAAVRATARTQRVHQGRHRRKETGPQAARRGLMDLALLQVMRDGLLRRSEAAALRWGDMEFHADGSGRLTIARSKTDQAAGGTTLYLCPAAVEALLAIRPEEAVTDPAGSLFGLSASQISRRIKAAGRMAGLGDGFSAHSPRVGMAQDLSAAGAELPAGEPWPSTTGGACGVQGQRRGRQVSNTASLIHTSKTTWTPCANTPLAYSDHVVDIPAEAVDEAFVGTAGQLITRLASEIPARRVPSPGEALPVL